MKIWYSKSHELCFLYYHPLDWNMLLALFNSDEMCAVEHFSGVTDGQSFYNTWYATSPEFLPMKEPMRLNELKTLVNKHVKWPHEYILTIGTIKIERSITGGIVFTSDDLSILLLIEKLNVPKELLYSFYENKLLTTVRTGRIKVEGEFTVSENLLDFIYDELMMKVSPDYFKFMDALAAAPFE